MSVVITPENIGAVPLERCVAAQDMSRRGARAGYVALKFYTNNYHPHAAGVCSDTWLPEKGTLKFERDLKANWSRNVKVA